MFTTKRIIKLMSLLMVVSVSSPLLAQDQAGGAHQHGQGQGQGRMQMFSRMDTNADGLINFAEFSAMPAPAAAQGNAGAMSEEATERRFTRLDTDGNGLLTQEEMRGGRGEGQRGNGQRGEGPRGNGQSGDAAQGQGQQNAQMRERMQNMTPEQREQMRERMRAMTPEQRAQMARDNQSQGDAPDSSANTGVHDH